MCRLGRVDAGTLHKIETGLHLGCELVPQLQWEVDIGGGERCDKCIFKRLDGAFCRVDSVIVWLHELQLAIVLRQELFDVFGRLVVHYVEFWF